ncbi:MAG: hypothetical protein RIS47_1691 [Bacteroidota bacterium]|jgi:pullulanase
MKIGISISILLLVFSIWGCHKAYEAKTYTSFDDYPVYSGNDLGLSYTTNAATFKIWAPTAAAVELRIYNSGLGGEAILTQALNPEPDGVWACKLDGDQLGKYYTFRVQIAGKWLAEVADPYAKAVGANGQRAQIIDLDEAAPKDWNNDKSPELASPADIILYELQIRDFSVDPNSGITNRGKYLAFTETGTHTPSGYPTGIDHIKSLGVTHVHILPSFDFYSINETLPDTARKYNWGYDPQNYNTPEGSFASDPHQGSVRIKEYKAMVQSLHKQGLRVVMDVVYNHTGVTENSNFNQIVPGYYYRQDTAGKFSNASGCGNETASERPMVRKFIIESLLYWQKAYHIDGFRFDLMAIHDIETMNLISKALHDAKPDVFLYGEGWTAGASPLPDSNKALKANGLQLDRIAFFSDELRDGVKGHVFEAKSPGFASGKSDLYNSVRFGIVGAVQHPQVNYDSVNYAKAAWAKSPQQCIGYVSAHDNNTLWDKIAISRPDASEADRIKIQTLANAIVLSSQGVPFLHAGVEFLRTKQGYENSFESPDSINLLDWKRAEQYANVTNYYTALIKLRKAHPALHQTDAKAVAENLQFSDTPSGTIVYTVSGNNDPAAGILAAFNGTAKPIEVALPEGIWSLALDSYIPSKLAASNLTKKIKIPPYSAIFLTK